MNRRPRIAIPQPTSTDPAYNLRCWVQYARAVELSGGIPISVDLGWRPEEVARTATACSAVLLPGSPADLQPQKYGQRSRIETAQCDPAREAVDELLLQDAFNLHKPTLGICYGLQSLNVWKGGTLEQHLTTAVAHDQGGGAVSHSVVLNFSIAESEDSCWTSAEFMVNSSHHQAVSRPGDGLTVAAVCPEDKTIEAVVGSERENGFVVGVQWHPERNFDDDAHSQRLFRCFVQAAERRLRSESGGAARSSR